MEMKSLKRLKRRKGYVKNELNILPITDKIIEYRTHWLNNLNRMNKELFPKQTLNYKP